jgi:hypothetical protein
MEIPDLVPREGDSKEDCRFKYILSEFEKLRTRFSQLQTDMYERFEEFKEKIQQGEEND